MTWQVAAGVVIGGAILMIVKMGVDAYDEAAERGWAPGAAVVLLGVAAVLAVIVFALAYYW